MEMKMDRASGQEMLRLINICAKSTEFTKHIEALYVSQPDITTLRDDLRRDIHRLLLEPAQKLDPSLPWGRLEPIVEGATGDIRIGWRLHSTDDQSDKE